MSGGRARSRRRWRFVPERGSASSTWCATSRRGGSRRCSCSAPTRSITRPATSTSPRLYAKVPLRVHAGPTSTRRRRSATGTCRSRMRSRTGATRVRRTGSRRSSSRSCGRCTTAARCTSSSPALTDRRPAGARAIVRQTWAQQLGRRRSLGRGAQDRFRRDAGRHAAASPLAPRRRAAAARQATSRDRLPSRPDDPRRQLRQQRLASGAAQAAVQDDLGECRRDQPGRSPRELEARQRRHAFASRAAAAPSRRRPWVLPGQPDGSSRCSSATAGRAPDGRHRHRLRRLRAAPRRHPWTRVRHARADRRARDASRPRRSTTCWTRRRRPGAHGHAAASLGASPGRAQPASFYPRLAARASRPGAW